MSSSFHPPIIIHFEADSSVIEIYRDWLYSKLMLFDKLGQEEIQKICYQFYSHVIKISTIYRDPLYIKIDGIILKYFHSRGELLFLKRVCYVKKTHQNRYTLTIETRFGPIRHNFSSIRECQQTTGLDFRKTLRKILY